MDSLRPGITLVPIPAPRTTRRRATGGLPSPGGAALRSAILPGWGQWAAGRRYLGGVIAFLAGAILALVAVTFMAVMRPFLPLPPLLDRAILNLGMLPMKALDRLLDAEWETVWQAAVGLNVVIILIRSWIVLDAANGAVRLSRVTGLLPRRGTLSRVAAVLAAGIIVLPHVALFGATSAVRPAISQIPTKPVKRAQPVGPTQNTVPGMTIPAEAETNRPLWDGTSRLNVLLLGTDRRPHESVEQPWGNSDTLLLVSVDPVTRASVMISLPRDLYLTIPGVGREKINAAYREGGPELAVRVVGDLIGQPIHRWASIDVSAFARMIDAVGGVVVDVERPIRDDEYPADNYAIRRIYIPAGLQWLNGEQALWYARSRHGSNDFDRAARQQVLLLGLKERARDRQIVSHLPVLFASLIDAVQTDVSPREALALMTLGTTADLRSNRLVLAPPVYGREIIRPDLYAIEPNVAQIRAAVADALASPAATTQGVLGGTAPAPLSQGGGMSLLGDNSDLDLDDNSAP
jgi:LCP family protein required for cell wall assembly